jgi:hypothetical protein
MPLPPPRPKRARRWRASKKISLPEAEAPAVQADTPNEHQAGAVQSSEQIWHDYHASLFNFIRRRVGNRALAEDLLQEVFLKIHTRLHNFERKK